MVVQLRRYELAEGSIDAFVERWRDIVAVRERFGFRVLFAFADREANEFVWAVAHDGDFAAAEKPYSTSEDRAAVVADLLPHLVASHVTFVDPVHGLAGLCG
ncbi:MAG: hypothetical protein S0880_06075 [Actinomycetota bacterium]|nr:hypothetical protein [Actinomycetota bacterium]